MPKGRKASSVAEVAEVHGFRTCRLGDGEVVIRLPRGDGAHAGKWGADCWYLLIPCSMPARRAGKLLAFEPALRNRSSDAEVLVLGSQAEILRCLLGGPVWSRARRRRIGRPAPHLAAHRFRVSGAGSGAGSESDAAKAQLCSSPALPSPSDADAREA
jgi:hypothetical protein